MNTSIEIVIRVGLFILGWGGAFIAMFALYLAFRAWRND